MYDREETDVMDVAFAQTLIGTQPKHILDVACGSGRFLISLAEAGHDVHGIDIDDAMLARIAPKMQKNIHAHWEKMNMLCGNWSGGYDVVLLAANLMLNIISDDDAAQAQELLIGKAASALVSGGHLLVDMNYTAYPEQWYNEPGERVIWAGTDSAGTTGKMSLCDSKFDRETGMIRSMRRFSLTFADGTPYEKEAESVKHYLEPAQVERWLENSGFVLEAVYGGYDAQPIGETTSRAIFWARKK